MGILSMLRRRGNRQQTLTEALLRQSIESLGGNPAPAGDLGRLVVQLQARSQVFALDAETAIFVDGQTKNLFENNATIAEILTPDLNVVLEYPFLATLRAKAHRLHIDPNEARGLPSHVGVMLQTVDGKPYVGVMFDYPAGPKAPPVMVAIASLNCHRGAPFWNRGVQLDDIIVSPFGEVALKDKQHLAGFAADVLQELPMLLGFLAMHKGNSPFLAVPTEKSGRGPRHVSLPSQQVGYRAKFHLSRISKDSFGWTPKMTATEQAKAS